MRLRWMWCLAAFAAAGCTCGNQRSSAPAFSGAEVQAMIAAADAGRCTAYQIVDDPGGKHHLECVQMRPVADGGQNP